MHNLLKRLVIQFSCPFEEMIQKFHNSFVEICANVSYDIFGNTFREIRGRFLWKILKEIYVKLLGETTENFLKKFDTSSAKNDLELDRPPVIATPV